MLPMLLFNVVSGLVMDKAQNLAKDHVGKMIDDILPDDAKEELNAMIKEDPEHEFESIEDALHGATAGKLPIKKVTGELMPIEMTVTVRFDPNTKQLEIVND